MVALAHRSIRTTWVLTPQIRTRHDAQIPSHPHRSYKYRSPLTTGFHDDSSPQTPPLPPPPQSSSPSPSSNRISPAVLFIIVILAVIFFISGLLHLLVRFIVKKRPSSPRSNSHQAAAINDASSSDALQRQLQQLFHLHDSGLDQAFIDALPVFSYREILGPKEPFDCAVCLCEFSSDDRLRLLPVCGHAFHLGCIDTWLLTNSTCPLCRGALFTPGLTFENPVFDLENPADDEGCSRADGSPKDLKEIVVEKRVFPVRLGKFRSSSNRNGNGGGDGGNICNARKEDGEESSSSNLDARRCFSMGSYEYILADENLQVELDDGSISKSRRVFDEKGGEEGKRLCVASKGESFSVSKIWLWSNNKGKLPISSEF